MADCPLAAARKILAPEFVGERGADAELPDWRGAYALLIRLDEIPDTGFCRPRDRLAPGWYAYAGSAHGAGGVGARLRHHMRFNKRRHWHVDALTRRAGRVIALARRDADECGIAARLRQGGRFEHVLPGFGSSDCRRCISHLLVWRG